MKTFWLKSGRSHRSSASAVMAAILIGSLAACSTSPTGRKQLTLLPDSQLDAMGVQAFEQMKAETQTVNDPELVNYVTCVVKPILKELPGSQDGKWEVQVFKDDTANAFALPGGKIGVHTGLLKVAKTDAQLAAVIGHEVGHVIAEHGNERVSQGLAAQGGLAIAGALTKDSPYRGLVMGALGLGTQVGVLLPFSRTQESEADLIGLDLMAKAGFDPQQSVELWKNMKAESDKAGGGAPPEFLSTHPSSDSRIKKLKSEVPNVLKEYRQARSDQGSPSCERPSKYQS
jgi:predicted Zn-dependent protease